MKLIVNADRQWNIGSGNDLIFHIPEDMKFFRAETMGKTVIMGRKTLDSFPGGKPLKNRVNIVLCPDKKQIEGCAVAGNLDELFEEIKKYDEVYVIGGAMTYHTLLPYCDEALITKVAADGGATVFFDNLDEMKNWSCVSESEPVETNGYEIKFTKYVNSDVKTYKTEQK